MGEYRLWHNQVCIKEFEGTDHDADRAWKDAAREAIDNMGREA